LTSRGNFFHSLVVAEFNISKFLFLVHQVYLGSLMNMRSLPVLIVVRDFEEGGTGDY
jgi:hypothetical protein